jgi:hypothetical protein
MHDLQPGQGMMAQMGWQPVVHLLCAFTPLQGGTALQVFAPALYPRGAARRKRSVTSAGLAYFWKQ